MKLSDTRGPEETARHNYYRLFMLRNAEIAVIITGVGVARLYFELQLSLPRLLVILAFIVALNIYTWYRLRRGSNFNNGEIFTLMLLDVAALTGIFYYTGAASNPFVWFYLLPLMIAATILPRWQAWSMGVITVICYTALFFIGAPLPAEHAHHGEANGFAMHVLGMWLGFVLSAGIVAVIIVGMAHSLRERDRKLARAREDSLKNERLVALGTLATGAAHELGTPLGTMAIVTAELEHEYAESDNSDLRKKLAILGTQISRCKDALSVLSTTAGAERAEAGHRMQVRQYLDETVASWQQRRPATRLQVRIDADLPPADILAEHTLSQALFNILDNAADASPDDVSLEAEWEAGELTLKISDRGPGLSEEVRQRLGQTPVSTKPEGLGVGLYLAHATITRLGGSCTISDRAGGGTVWNITLPLLTKTDGTQTNGTRTG